MDSPKGGANNKLIVTFLLVTSIEQF